MSYKLYLTAFFIALLSVLHTWGADKIKVACVGNSVTYGYGIQDREQNCYPAQLQQMLGDSYDVRNFGRSSATMTHRSPMWYMAQPEYRQAIDFKADIVIIHLGLNDTDPRWWPNYSEEFIPDYRALIDSFRVSNPEAKIWICLMTPISHDHRRFQSGTRDWHEQIQMAIHKVAVGANVKLIDLFTPLYSRPELFPDALHPNAEGAAILARTVCQNITGKFGGLQMPLTYSNGMVLQRDKTLTISGIANANNKITVKISTQTQTATSSSRTKKASKPGKKQDFTDNDKSAQGGEKNNQGRNKNKQDSEIISQATAEANGWGQWSVSLPPLQAGGPYTLTITSPDSTISYRDVWMGDVWLCSGQSNMMFNLTQCATYPTDQIEAPQQKRIHVLNLYPIAETNNVEWTPDILTRVNRLEYLDTPGWQSLSQASLSHTSAVAYHFGKALSDSLNDIHIGLICNPVGGTPTEAWIDRWTLQYDYPQILYNWLQNDHIQQWVRERGGKNIKQASNPLQRHPYEPCYMFESGIQPLGHIALKGVIWYQGESNAHNTELHERLFPLMLKSWRNWFNDAEIPFYFVQLSSLSRPSWPRFRDSQRRLADKLDNVWMAVSTDLGDSLDVHPTRKQEVGQRLALQALRHTYGHTNLVSEGPKPLTIDRQDKELVITFTEGNVLGTSNGSALSGFELAGPDGLFYPVGATFSGNTVRIRLNQQTANASTVRYGWQPFTRANLVNQAGLPASTFQIDFLATLTR